MTLQLNDGDQNTVREGGLRDRFYKLINGHPVLSKALSIEVILFSIALVLAAVGTKVPGPGIGVVHMFAGLAVVLMMVLALTLVVASVLVYTHRGVRQALEQVPV